MFLDIFKRHKQRKICMQRMNQFADNLAMEMAAAANGSQSVIPTDIAVKRQRAAVDDIRKIF